MSFEIPTELRGIENFDASVTIPFSTQQQIARENAQEFQDRILDVLKKLGTSGIKKIFEPNSPQHVRKFKTVLCNSSLDNSPCKHRKKGCIFAHSLRVLWAMRLLNNPNFKSMPCASPDCRGSQQCPWFHKGNDPIVTGIFRNLFRKELESLKKETPRSLPANKEEDDVKTQTATVQTSLSNHHETPVFEDGESIADACAQKVLEGEPHFPPLPELQLAFTPLIPTIRSRSTVVTTLTDPISNAVVAQQVGFQDTIYVPTGLFQWPSSTPAYYPQNPSQTDLPN